MKRPFIETALDLVSLTDSEALAHLTTALPAGEFTAGQLAAGVVPRFTVAPERAMAAKDIGFKPNGPSLTIGTFNVGLLDRTYLGTRIQVPEIESRRAYFARRILQEDVDIWLLQEVWEPCDYHRLHVLAEASGYRVFSAMVDARSAHGLAILIKDCHIEVAEPRIVCGAFYPNQYLLEYFPGPKIRRAWLSVHLHWTPWRRAVTIFNTHLTSQPQHWQIRNAQARVLGLAARRAQRSAITIVGGDLNADSSYAHITMKHQTQRRLQPIWQSGATHALLRHYGALSDIAERGGITRLDHTVEAGNPIHFEMYGDTLPNARLDHLLVNSSAPVRVHSARRIFTMPCVPLRSGTIHLSDHYGIISRLHLVPTEG